jgi:hypothetical protein
MKNKNDKSDPDKVNLDKKDKNKVPDSLLYPPSEDIYNQFQKEIDIDPEDISKKKMPVEKIPNGKLNQKDFDEDVSGSDLDVPGSELDNDLEGMGSEDEENSHYGIGGDNHNDLEENKD